MGQSQLHIGTRLGSTYGIKDTLVRSKLGSGCVRAKREPGGKNSRIFCYLVQLLQPMER